MSDYVAKTAAEMAYLGEQLSNPPCVGLLDNAHPVSGKLAGKKMRFEFEAIDMFLEAHFVDDKNIEWWFAEGPNSEGDVTIWVNQYVAFEITENIFFVSWVEPSATTIHSTKVWKNEYHTAFVLDLNKMILTDSFTGPTDDGGQELIVAQARASYL